MSDAFLAHLHDLFADFGPVSLRAMFGGHGLYHEGTIIGVVIDEALYLKADEHSRADFAATGGEPFVYHAKGRTVAMSYWSLPEEAMESPQAMRPWAERAYAAALRKPKPPARGGGRPGSRQRR
jgi:DNA transformation protein